MTNFIMCCNLSSRDTTNRHKLLGQLVTCFPLSDWPCVSCLEEYQNKLGEHTNKRAVLCS